MKNKCFILDLDDEKLDSGQSEISKWLESYKEGNEKFFDITRCSKLDQVLQECSSLTSDNFVLICIFAKQKVENNEFSELEIRQLMDDFLPIGKKIPVIFYINDKRASLRVDLTPLTMFTQCENIFVTFSTRQALFYIQQLSSIKSSINQNLENVLTATDKLDILLEYNDMANKRLTKSIENELNTKDKFNYDINGFGVCHIVSSESKMNSTDENNQIEKLVAQIKTTFGKCKYGLYVKTPIKMCKKEDLLKVLENIASNFDKDDDCLVMFFIGRIDGTDFYCSNNKKIKIKKIIKKIDEICSLSFKPKILIFQNPLNEKINCKFDFLPKDDFYLPKDFLLIHSTHYQIDTSLITSKEKNTNFIGLLCDQITANSDKYDFVKLLQNIFVRNMFQKEYTTNLDSIVYIKSKLRALVCLRKDEEECDSNLIEEGQDDNATVTHFSETKKRIRNNSINYPQVSNGKGVILKFIDKQDTDANDDMNKAAEKIKDSLEQLGITFKDGDYPVDDYGGSLTNVSEELNEIYDNIMYEPSNSEHDVNCFFLFVFTNNHDEAETTREKIVDYFTNFEAMLGKPKFIFVQGKQDYSPEPDKNKINSDTAHKYYSQTNNQSIAPADIITIAKHSDILILFNNGAPVKETINLFCDKLVKYSGKLHLVEILSLFLKKLGEDLTKLGSNLPYISSTFTRNLKLSSIETSQDIEAIDNTLIVKSGKFVILNYINVKNQSKRESSRVDSRELKRIFEEICKFSNIPTSVDKTEVETRIFLINEIKIANFEEYDCFVMCYLSHGDFNGVLYCNVGYINQDDLINALCENKSLTGKPKIIIIQACQGTLEHGGDRIMKPDDEGNNDSEVQEQYKNFNFTYKEHSNLLIITSSYPGYYSYRYSLSGSKFIKTFCEIFEQNYGNHDLLTMASMVCREIGYNYQSKIAGYKRQLPHVFHTLINTIKFKIP